MNENFPFPPAQDVLPAKKICQACGIAKEYPEFVFHAHKHHKVCKQCEAANVMEIQRQAEAQVTERENSLKMFVAKLRGDRIDAPHISEVCEQMFKRFGGVEAFSIEFHRQIQKAVEAKPGSKTVLDAYYAVVKLALLSTENRLSAPDVADLDNEDIEKELKALIQRNLPAPPVQGLPLMPSFTANAQ
jgi:hypothetical protein